MYYKSNQIISDSNNLSPKRAAHISPTHVAERQHLVNPALPVLGQDAHSPNKLLS